MRWVRGTKKDPGENGGLPKCPVGRRERVGDTSVTEVCGLD